MGRYLLILVERGRGFRELEGWCRRFDVGCIGSFVATSEDLGRLRTLSFLAERRGATTLQLELGRGVLGLFMARCGDQRKLFTDLLPRIVKRLGLYTPSTSYRGLVVAFFPSTTYLGEFEKFEVPALRSYVETLYIGPAAPLRLKDRQVLASLAKTLERTRTFRDIASKVMRKPEEVVEEHLEVYGS